MHFSYPALILINSISWCNIKTEQTNTDTWIHVYCAVDKNRIISKDSIQAVVNSGFDLSYPNSHNRVRDSKPCMHQPVLLWQQTLFTIQLAWSYKGNANKIYKCRYDFFCKYRKRIQSEKVSRGFSRVGLFGSLWENAKGVWIFMFYFLQDVGMICIQLQRRVNFVEHNVRTYMYIFTSLFLIYA